MIELAAGKFKVTSGEGVVRVSARRDEAWPLMLDAEALKDLESVLAGACSEVAYRPLSHDLMVGGTLVDSDADMAEVLVVVLHAARFARGGTLDEVMEDRTSFGAQRKAVSLRLEVLHLRARVAAVLGVSVLALSAFTEEEFPFGRATDRMAINGSMRGVPVKFTLRYEHLMVTAQGVDGRKVRSFDDVQAALESSRVRSASIARRNEEEAGAPCY